ncbi:GNAT family N-acetyltransferase [Gordonibacter sp. An230]|uniref:GNAT family N-acetyltransferase n=1 Tax=Gordonibacter sp. An230 TaxID=1965592 RepID=UPI000B3A8622|nr:GNAT family N-acetyltransferase [Gordonibacter sp. An230]OUO90462.1 GNAT family N-acetyltransferase [Gordonibacter sp. An230]
MPIAVSACLLGEPCRYDGESRSCEAVLQLGATREFVGVCPEMLGGLPVPRTPCEIVAAERALRVVDADGGDVTDAFLAGAAKTVELASERGCTLAVLKAKSPSCGCGLVYDGTFAGVLVPGYGVAARALREAGVRTLDESQFAACLEASAAQRPGQVPAVLAETSAECPSLETKRLVLRPLISDDIDDVFAYCSDPAVDPDAGWAPHRTREDARMFVEVIAHEPHVFGIFEKRGDGADAGAVGPCIGSIGLIRDPQRRNVDCLMLGYALARRAWGRGYMTEASSEVLRYGFEELSLAMITCTHYSFNARSRRVIEKLGFVREGTLHGIEATLDGLMQDCECYYLVRERWMSTVASLPGGEGAGSPSRPTSTVDSLSTSLR